MFRSFKAISHISTGLLFMVVLMTGCGGGGQMAAPPVQAGTTNVMVVLTSTANDKLTQFNMAITSISLNGSAGSSVTIFNKPFVQNGAFGPTEFMHLNGVAQPLVTSTVPQGTYTSATVKVAACQFSTISEASGAVITSSDEEGVCAQGTGNTTVVLSSPIIISGQNMALALNLQIFQSYTVNGIAFTVSPVFTLSPITVASLPTNATNGKLAGLSVQITSVNPANNNFTAQTADGTPFTMNTRADTEFQGVNGLPSITVGMLANLDGSIQSDGTLLATRMEVNPAAAIEALMIPIAPASPAGTALAQPVECFPGAGNIPICTAAFTVSNTTAFHVSGQVSNLRNLPFTPIFDSSNFVLGQNVSVSTDSAILAGGFQASDITLEPQTMNGIVTAASTAGSFSVYTISIAPYHAIPVTQQQTVVAPFVSVPSPTIVTVYADANTQLLQAGAIAPGSVLRFRGLLFNDGGALRLDCAEILNGVAE